MKLLREVINLRYFDIPYNDSDIIHCASISIINIYSHYESFPFVDRIKSASHNIKGSRYFLTLFSKILVIVVKRLLEKFIEGFDFTSHKLCEVKDNIGIYLIQYIFIRYILLINRYQDIVS